MSFDFNHLLLVLTVYVIGAASPGPSNMRIMGVAMHQGRRPALMLAFGVISGSFFWGGMAATGISAILTTFAQAIIALKIVGGAYLLFLGIKAARSALTTDEHMSKKDATAASVSGFKLYKQGLMMHLTNPKALLGWVATMTLGLGPQASTTTVAITLACCAVLSITIFGGYALLFSTAPMVRAYRRARRGIEGTLALVFGVAGINLLLSRQ
ncbi:threonine efflux protein [Pseudomonas laurentiana]|uniref:LysE family translocator n=1 Tax=Pseudomonas laurentiana TaxID=2364649 RepID=A0A6I5RSE7_9PSED|nr:LysE family translocator [Pseudomonas laurentiana]NES10665.1 LysE family translocator [Pseudomonas laurentiana]GGU53265.1 threonine efflux protein [Pseudomonas laurentiana]